MTIELGINKRSSALTLTIRVQTSCWKTFRLQKSQIKVNSPEEFNNILGESYKSLSPTEQVQNTQSLSSPPAFARQKLHLKVEQSSSRESLDTYKVHGRAFEPSTHLGGPLAVVWRNAKISSFAYPTKWTLSQRVCVWSSVVSPSPAGSLHLTGGPETLAESCIFTPARSLSSRLHHGMRCMQTCRESHCSAGTSPGTAAPPLRESLSLPPLSFVQREPVRLSLLKLCSSILLPRSALLPNEKWQGRLTSGSKYVSSSRSKISL